MLPYGSGIGIIMYVCSFFSNTFLQSGIDKLDHKGSPIPACPSFMCYAHKGNIEETILGVKCVFVIECSVLIRLVLPSLVLSN